MPFPVYCCTKHSSHRHAEARRTLFVGLTMSFVFLFAQCFFLQKHAFYCKNFLHDTRCTNLLLAVSYAFPFSSIHSCICGYYLGLKRTRVPALSQLAEQISRVLFVYGACYLMFKKHMAPSVSIAVFGLVCGEIIFLPFTVFFIFPQKLSNKNTVSKMQGTLSAGIELFRLSAPLTANRILLNILQSIEAVSIPSCLILYGLTNSDALSTYGVLTGMAALHFISIYHHQLSLHNASSDYR